MGALQEKLTTAIQLREAQNHEEARQLLLQLHRDFPDDPQVNYQCAWIHDLLGLEADTSRDEGIRRYERAIRFYSDKLDQTW